MGAELPLLVTFVGYCLILMVVAYLSTKLTYNLSDYVLAGRRLSGPIVALGAGASDMSSWLLMALPGAVYQFGLSMIWLPVALLVGAYCNWRFIAKRLRVYTEVAGDALTIPEFLTNRFKANNSVMRIVTSLVILIFFTYYSAAGFVSGAILIEYAFTGVDYHTALYVSGAVIVLYTAVGGFLAVNWIDFFQGALMLFALIVVPIVALTSLGGLNITIESIAQQSAEHLNIWQNIKVLGLLSMFAWGLGYFGQLHISARFMAVRSIKELPIARIICMNWMALALIGAIATGLFGFLFYFKNPLAEPDTVFILLSQKLFNPWLSGILLSAVASAIMSTVSAQILMSASILAEDFYHDMLRKDASDSENIWAGRISLLLASLAAIAIAARNDQSILKAVGFAWSGLGCAFGPVLLFSLFWRRTTYAGALWGIISGAGTVLLWGYLSEPGQLLYHADTLPGFEMLPGFITSSLVIIVVSLRGPKPQADIVAEFDQTQQIIVQESSLGNQVLQQ